MTETELVVAGYCRSIQASLYNFNNYIPISIVELCIKFYEAHAIITIPIGQCGILVGNFFAGTLMDEYAINSNSINNTYFRSTNNATILRSILIDLEPGTFDCVERKFLYQQENLIFGCYSAGNNWAKGHYTEGAEIMEEYVLPALRNEIENYDAPQGIQMFHNVGGGTGSGLGTLIMSEIADHFPDLDIMSISLFPDSKTGGCVVRPYNTILSTHKMDEFCHGSFVIETDTLFNLAYNRFKINMPRFRDINVISNQIINDITSLFCYNDSYKFSMRSFLNEMVKYAKLKYFVASRAPFYDEKGNILAIEKSNKLSLLQKVFESKNRAYTSCIIQDGINLSTILLQINPQNNEYSLNDIPVVMENDPIITTINKKGLYNGESLTLIANSTSVKNVFQEWHNRFRKMFRRKAFLHWYKGEGMDEMEFIEAAECVYNIITQYSEKEQTK